MQRAHHKGHLRLTVEHPEGIPLDAIVRVENSRAQVDIVLFASQSQDRSHLAAHLSGLPGLLLLHRLKSRLLVSGISFGSEIHPYNRLKMTTGLPPGRWLTHGQNSGTRLIST